MRSNPEDESGQEVASGAPPFPGDPDSVEWADPELVLVHYDVSGWNLDQRAELAESLAERNVPHKWDGEELVVPEMAEEFTDALFGELEAELGPFAVPLDPDDPGTEFGLDEWPVADLDALRASLIEAAIPHRWEGLTLLVATESEHEVDDLLDAIEAGEAAALDSEAPEGALHDLYNLADALVRDPADGQARSRLLELLPQLSPQAAPYGLAGRAWSVILERAQGVEDVFADAGRPEDVIAAADELRNVSRPYV